MQKRRVLIASSHPLFGQGLRRLLQEHQQTGVEVVGMVANVNEAIQALDRLDPDLIIVDYDDERLNRDEFLARFVEGEKKLRVVLLSLQSAKDAIVYDRRTLAAAQIDDWLEEWTYTDETTKPNTRRRMVEPITDHRRGFMKNRFGRATHLIIASILVVISTILIVLGLNSIRYLPIAASKQAGPIDSLFKIESYVIGFLFSLIVVFMLYSIVVFRRRKGDETDAAHIEGNSKLEVAWTIAPLITVLTFAYLGSVSLAQVVAPDPKPLRVEVVAKQWQWTFVYPELGITSNELYMPQNKQALLLLSSEDVIHSFWVPEFRVKQDALPGGTNFIRPLRVTPTVLGDYKVRCSELCGQRHAYMEAPVHVVSQADFDAWSAKAAGLSDNPVERGQKWSSDFGCISCHSINGTKIVGPSWKDMCSGQVTLSNGQVVNPTDDYIHESIINPDAQIVQGFPSGVMPKQFIHPATKKPITDQQISDIIAYMRSICQ